MQKLNLTITYLNKYKFNLYTYEAPYYEKSWIYIVWVLNNDKSKFSLKYIWKTDDLSNRWMDNHNNIKCFKDNNCNCLWFLEINSSKDRTEIEEELIKTQKPNCNILLNPNK